jgi:hypothetical protein
MQVSMAKYGIAWLPGGGIGMEALSAVHSGGKHLC